LVVVEAELPLDRTPGDERFDEPPELSRDHGVAWRPIVKRVGPLPSPPGRSRVIRLVAEHAQEEIRERLDERPRVDRGHVRRATAEPGRLPARAVADVDPEHAAAFGQPASTPHAMDSRYAARTASLHAP